MQNIEVALPWFSAMFKYDYKLARNIFDEAVLLEYGDDPASPALRNSWVSCDYTPGSHASSLEGSNAPEEQDEEAQPAELSFDDYHAATGVALNTENACDLCSNTSYDSQSGEPGPCIHTM